MDVPFVVCEQPFKDHLKETKIFKEGDFPPNSELTICLKTSINFVNTGVSDQEGPFLSCIGHAYTAKVRERGK